MFPFVAPKFIQPPLLDHAYLYVESMVPLVIDAKDTLKKASP
ncbi:MAG: hypothetical protein ABIJ84_02065 [bacterium]